MKNENQHSGTPIRVEVLRRSMYGKYMGKVYTFKNKRHMDAWVEKWFVKLGVDQFNVIGQGEAESK